MDTNRRARPAGPAPRSLFGRNRGLLIAASALAALLAAPPARAQGEPDRAQGRKSKERVPVPVNRIQVDDGDTVTIEWGPNDREIVRILGIDTPETRHPEHGLPIDQAFGPEARAFCAGAFAAARTAELLRAETKDPYGRTLGYLFVNGHNYSVLVVRARLAVESISRYGDNGFPLEAAEVLAAARAVAPVPFENPGDFRRRMREIQDWEQSRQP